MGYRLFGRIALAAAVIVTPAHAEPAAAPVITFDQAASQTWIAMPDPDLSNQIVIPVMLNGHIEQALLDTGVYRLLIDSRRARALGLKTRPLGTTPPATGAALLEGAPIETFDVGGLHQRGGDIVVSDLSGLIALSPHPFTMIISADYLKQFAIDLDFDAARLRFRRSGSRWAIGTDLPLTIKPSGSRFLTAIGINGHRVAPVVIDTGSTDTLSIDGDVAQRVLDNQPVSDRMAARLGGTYVSRLFHARSVALGASTLDDVPTTIAAGEVLHDTAGPPSQALLGLALLKRFNVTLDASAGRLTLAPRLRTPPPEPISTSGIQGLYQADGLSVVHVMRGSPAEAAGVKGGDRICRVDGAIVDAGWSPAQRKWSIGAPGRRVVLTLCDGRSLPIVLARFY
jgi:predicted aspartyl protease